MGTVESLNTFQMCCTLEPGWSTLPFALPDGNCKRCSQRKLSKPAVYKCSKAQWDSAGAAALFVCHFNQLLYVVFQLPPPALSRGRAQQRLSPAASSTYRRRIASHGCLHPPPPWFWKAPAWLPMSTLCHCPTPMATSLHRDSLWQTLSYSELTLLHSQKALSLLDT